MAVLRKTMASANLPSPATVCQWSLISLAPKPQQSLLHKAQPPARPSSASHTAALLMTHTRPNRAPCLPGNQWEPRLLRRASRVGGCPIGCGVVWGCGRAPRGAGRAWSAGVRAVRWEQGRAGGNCLPPRARPLWTHWSRRRVSTATLIPDALPGRRVGCGPSPAALGAASLSGPRK